MRVLSACRSGRLHLAFAPPSLRRSMTAAADAARKWRRCFSDGCDRLVLMPRRHCCSSCQVAGAAAAKHTRRCQEVSGSSQRTPAPELLTPASSPWRPCLQIACVRVCKHPHNYCCSVRKTHGSQNHKPSAAARQVRLWI